MASGGVPAHPVGVKHLPVIQFFRIHPFLSETADTELIGPFKATVRFSSVTAVTL